MSDRCFKPYNIHENPSTMEDALTFVVKTFILFNMFRKIFSCRNLPAVKPSFVYLYGFSCATFPSRPNEMI